MTRIVLMLSASLLLISGCGRTVSTADSAYLKPSTSTTLADKNRHDLLASSHLESGIHYVIPEVKGTPAPTSTRSQKTSKATEKETAEESLPSNSDSPKKLKSDSLPSTTDSVLPPVRPQAIGFTLKDPKGKTYTYQFPREKLTLLAFADREGAGQMEKWIRPLYEKFTDQIDIQGIADLSAVPRFARGIAQGIVSGLVKYPILLDWDGNISQAYKVEKGKTNLFVIDPQGKIHLHLTGAAIPEKLAKATTLIETLQQASD